MPNSLCLYAYGDAIQGRLVCWRRFSSDHLTAVVLISYDQSNYSRVYANNYIPLVNSKPAQVVNSDLARTSPEAIVHKQGSDPVTVAIAGGAQ